MASEILGLFTSPEDYQRQQDLMMQRQAAELAQLDPYQSIRFNAIRAGQRFGQGLAGILGAQDPQLRMITARQSALRGINLGDPESIFTAAQQLADAGDQQGALTLADYGRKAQADKALAEQRTRERMSPALQAAARVRDLTTAKQKLLTEGVSAESPEMKIIDAEIESLRRGGKAPGADLTDAQKNARALALLKGEEGTEEYNTEYSKQLTSLLNKGGKANLTVVGEAKSGADKGKAVYVDETNDQQFVYDTNKEGKQYRKPFTGEVDRITSSIVATATALPPGPKQVVEGLGKLDVEDVQIARQNKRSAAASNKTLMTLSKLNDQGLISGTYASGRAGVANLFNTLGLASPADASNLARSEQFQKLASDLIVQALGGKLGGGISNVDLAFVERIVPRLENSPQARRELINYLVEKNNEIIKEANNVEDYLRKNNSLSGYTPKIPGIYTPPSSPVSKMTDQQLRDLYNKGKGAK